MEAKPFNVNVMLVSPGAVKSNIANNSAASFQMPEDSLYKDFIKNIYYRMNVSQAGNSMPTEKFVAKVASNALQPKPPGYITLGGNASTFSFFKWLPRAWVLWFMWRIYSKRL